MNSAQQERLEYLKQQQRIKQEREQLVTLLSSLPQMRFLGFVDETDHVPSAWNLWQQIISTSTAPTSKISYHVRESEHQAWLNDQARQAQLGSCCYLSFEMYLPWAAVEAVSSDWLRALWDQPQVSSLIILNWEQSRMLGLWKDLDDELAFVLMIAATERGASEANQAS